MDFQDAIQKIEERGDFNRFVELRPIFLDRLKELKEGDHTERGLCYYYLLVSYLKAHLVHETEESIVFYERMDEAFTKQLEQYRTEYRKFSWSEMTDYFRLMERCYESIEFLYSNHQFKTRKLQVYRQKMNFRKAAALFNRHYGRSLEYKFLELTSNYGTSLFRWSLTTFAFIVLMACGHYLIDQLVDPSLRTISEDAHLFDYLYFSTVTFTTVGFGDVFPLSLAGKILTMFEAFFGLLMLGVFIGLIQRRLQN